MRILVVEDDRLLNNTLCYNLDAAGYVVDSALTKSAASDFLTKQDYDLIVLDVNLPDGNGFDFCREVKERRPNTAVIFLTANDMESDMLKGYELGAEDCAQLITFEHIALHIICSQEDHRCIRPALLYLTAEIKAIPIRQVYIQHDQVIVLLGQKVAGC